jgi:hypothetical protein
MNTAAPFFESWLEDETYPFEIVMLRKVISIPLPYTKKHRTALPPSTEYRPFPSITRPVSESFEGSVNMYTVVVKEISAPNSKMRLIIKEYSSSSCVVIVNKPMIFLQFSLLSSTGTYDSQFRHCSQPEPKLCEPSGQTASKSTVAEFNR